MCFFFQNIRKLDSPNFRDISFTKEHRKKDVAKARKLLKVIYV